MVRRARSLRQRLDSIPNLMRGPLAFQLRMAAKRLKDPHVSIWFLKGQLRGRVPVQVLLACRRALLAEARGLLFNVPVESREVAQTTPWQLREELRRYQSSDTDIVMWETWPWSVGDAAAGRYVVQAWMDAVATPGNNFEDYLAHHVGYTIQRTLRRARHGILDLSTTTDVAVNTRFYHEMVLPTALHLYGPDHFAPDLDKFLNWGRGGERHLLLLKREGVTLGGMTVVFSSRPPVASAVHFGVHQDVLQDRALRRDVMAQMDAWLFRQACERGLSVNMALTRPFLDDGVFNYKRQWGCSLKPVAAYPRYGLELVSPRAEEVLFAAPFFHLTAQGVAGVMAYHPDAEHGAHELHGVLNASVFSGLSDIQVYVDGSENDVASMARELPEAKGCPIRFRAAAKETSVVMHA